MKPDELWRRYAAVWSAAPDQRRAELEACLHEDCSYCDPNGLLVGRDALADYMESFGRSLPGASFEITSVAEHHGRSLSRWALRGRGV